MPIPADLPTVPVTVTSTGFTWTSFFTGGSMMALFGLLIKQVGPWRKQTIDEQNQLIDRLSHRLDNVEKQLATERKVHFIEIRRLEARNAAQRSLDRHKFNNSEACLDSLLRILEMSPEKAPEAARRAREDRLEHRRAEQLEAAEIHKAEMLAVEMAERELADQDKLETAHG